MFKILKQRKYALIAIILTIFFLYVFLWQVGLYTILGIGSFRTSAILPTEIPFSIVMSILLGLFTTGFYALAEQAKKIVKAQEKAVGTLAVLISMFALLCPICNIGFLLSFGIAINFSFLLSYLWIFQLLAVILMCYALYLLDKRIKTGVGVCHTKQKK